MDADHLIFAIVEKYIWIACRKKSLIEFCLFLVRAAFFNNANNLHSAINDNTCKNERMAIFFATQIP